jgi:uncharacterized protein (TIGR03437 family)
LHLRVDVKFKPAFLIGASAITTLCALASATPTSLQFVPFSNPGGTAILAKGILPLSGAAVAVYGGETLAGCVANVIGGCKQNQAPLLAILSASGKQTASLAASALGSGNSTIVSAAVDAAGDIWITGETDSDDFPLIHALFTQKTAYRLTGFVAKLDAGLNILFSSFLGGQTVPTTAQSTPATITLDSTGNAYVAGNTADPSFPVTGPAFAAAPTGSYAFIAKIAPDGSKLIYSRLLGGSTSPCVGGSTCIGRGAYTNATAIAVDAMGSATVAGQTYSTNFPATTNVYNTKGGAFISRISADGSSLVWSTEVGVTSGIPGGSPGMPTPSSVQSIALDSADNVYIAGSAFGPIAATPGALQSTYKTAPGLFAAGFVLKLSSDATRLVFATNLAGNNGAALTGLALDAAQNAWVTGFTASSDFPGLGATGSAGLDFALELNGSATALQAIFPLIPQTVSQPPVFDSDGNLLLLASAGNLLRLNPATAYSASAAFALANAAIPRAAASIAPGEIMTVYGVALGPSAGTVAKPNSNGFYPTELGGVSVQITGPGGVISAPLLYVGPNQINFEVTPNLYAASTVIVVTPSGPLPAMTINVAGSIGVFGVLNTDGSVNSAANPAKDGSIVSLYLTGLGLPGYAYNALDGAIAPAANSAFMNLVEVDWSGGKVPLPVFYAGTAPGQIDGLAQINVQLPAKAQNPILGVQNPVLTVVVPAVYDTTLPATSNSVVVYVQ